MRKKTVAAPRARPKTRQAKSRKSGWTIYEQETGWSIARHAVPTNRKD